MKMLNFIMFFQYFDSLEIGLRCCIKEYESKSINKLTNEDILEYISCKDRLNFLNHIYEDLLNLFNEFN